MNLECFINQAHLLFMARYGRKTQAKVAMAIGIKPRTYVEYLRGVNQPKGMIALLNMLCMLPERDVIELLSKWKKQNKDF
jgi:hypothetical protein